ncbi:MAG: hypothetical protein R3F49_19165 [Planctomycetota bacterium]
MLALLSPTGLRSVALVVCAALGPLGPFPALGALGRAPALDPRDGPDIDVSLAVEDGEVRLQLITNLAFLDAFADVPREDPGALLGADLELAREALFDLFAREVHVTADGAEREPTDAGFELEAGEPALLAHFPRFGARALTKTRLTLVYPLMSPPRQVGVVWGVFPPDVSRRGTEAAAPTLDVVCRWTGGGRSELVRFSRAEPEHLWHRPAEGASHLATVPAVAPLPPRSAVPWPALAAVAAAIAAGLAVWRGPRPLRAAMGLAAVTLTAWAALLATEAPRLDAPTPAEARAIFEPLHTNIYRAFDFTRDEDVYDALAASVDGQLLDRLYDEVYRGLIVQEEGGAVSRVERVEHLSVEVVRIGQQAVEGAAERAPAARTSFVVDTRWQVAGAVYHWGHAHFRTNEYRAEYTVAALDGGWRIVASRMLEQRRVDAAPLADTDQ